MLRRGRSVSPGESLCHEVPCVETPKGRKKFSFKEPEIMGFLGFRRMSLMRGSRKAPPQRSKSLQPPAAPSRDAALEDLESQAMRVVRTVGQAFEVCHKLRVNNPRGAGPEDQQSNNDRDRVGGDGENHRRDALDDYDDRDEFASLQQPSPSSVHKDISLLGDPEDSILDQPCPLRNQEVTTTTGAGTSPLRQSPLGNAMSEQLMNGELTALKHEIQLLRERLDQQSQQTRAAVAHARLLQDQLAAETAARVEAQAGTHQLLVQNKELLEHIAALVSHLREHERISGVPLTGQPGQVTAAGTIPQGSAVPDIAALGQYNSAWEPHTSTSSHYSPLESYYSGLASSPFGYTRPNSNDYAEELRYQAQLWENLRGTTSPYTTPAPLSPLAPHYYGPGFTLPPTGRPRSVQSPGSPASTLPRASRVPRSPVLSPYHHQQQQQQQQQQHQQLQQRLAQTPPPSRSRSLERPSCEAHEASFIKPLPCKCQEREIANAYAARNRCALKNSLHDLMRPLVLDPPPAGRSRGVGSCSELLSRACQTEPCLGHNGPCPLIVLGEDAPDSMPKIEESEDSGEEEKADRVADLPPAMRRNSQ